MNSQKYPFLWNFIITEKIQPTMSGGQERPLTNTIAEESNPAFVDVT